MSTDRLTEKAKNVMRQIVGETFVSAKKLLKIIQQEEGLGSYLVQTVTPRSIKKLTKISPEALLKEAFFQAIRLEHTYVGTEHLYLAVLKLSSKKGDYKILDAAKIELVRLGVFPTKMEKTIDKISNTPLLDAFGEDLNHEELRKLNQKVVYRPEYEKMVSALLLKDKSNVLIVGEPGVGKRSLVRLLTQNINALDVPPALVGYNLRSLNILSFMTSIANKGGIEFVVATLVEELRTLKRVIIVLNNFQDLFFATPAGLSIPIFYSVLKSYFEDAGISVITFLTPQIYDKLSVENDHIIDNFTVLELNEPQENDTKKILRENAKILEKYHNVEITDSLIDYVYVSALDKIKDERFPQKGIDVLDYACASVIARKSKIPQNYKSLVDRSYELSGDMEEYLEEGAYDAAQKVKDKLDKIDLSLDKKERLIFMEKKPFVLQEKDIDKVVQNMDIEGDDKTKAQDFSKIAHAIKKDIIGQDDAVDVVSRALIRAKLGLRSKKRPLGNFLFLGPTGVGKTELAKVLAAHGFATGTWKGLIRLDMSDFSEKHTVARLVGAPPGYIGYGEGGELTSKIENHPDSVVLFDEIEKAHPDVLNILLQIMEEGELSDARGNVFDFSKSVVILTSNLGTEILHSKGIGYEEKDYNDDKVEARLKDNLKKIMKAELLNRFDEIVVFKRLSRNDSMKILILLLKEVSGALLTQNITIRVLLSAKRFLLEKGFSKEYGARALRRMIEKDVLDKIAQVILENEKRPLSLRILEKDQQIIVEEENSKKNRKKKKRV